MEGNDARHRCRRAMGNSLWTEGRGIDPRKCAGSEMDISQDHGPEEGTRISGGPPAGCGEVGQKTFSCRAQHTDGTDTGVCLPDVHGLPGMRTCRGADFCRETWTGLTEMGTCLMQN